MSASSLLMFFFSALGAFNGFILALYFALLAKRKVLSNYFLSMLLLMLSIRIIKSVFFYFNPDLANIFIQIGLSACILIGPFLYLYLQSYSDNEKPKWPLHILPYLIGITALGISYPYVEHQPVWSNKIVVGIYLQWVFYIILSFKFVLPIFKKIIAKEKLKNIEKWLLSVYIGVFIIWLAYYTANYTSYIVGSLSFSFMFYLIVLLFIFRKDREAIFYQEKEKEKYKNKEMDQETISQIETAVSKMIKNELFLNPNLTLDEAAKELNVSKHSLSQYLNEKLNKSFTVFINEHRIEKAKELLKSNNNYTVEGLGYDSGFNSKSTFFNTFKKITGTTPAEFQKNFAK